MSVGRISALAVSIVSVTSLSTGCAVKQNRLEILSLRTPTRPESFVEVFPEAHFRVNSGKAYEIVLQLRPALLEVPLGDESFNDASSQPAAPPDLVWTSQWVHIQLLWQALPGKTYAESSQTNAAIIYCLVNGDNAVSYEGAGFVYFKESRDGQTLEGRIESASLRPTRFKGDPVDLFGPCRIHGEFRARNGTREVAEVRQRIRRLLGSPYEGLEGPV